MLNENIQIDPEAASEVPLVQLLRRIRRGTWAEVREIQGWSFNTDIGKLTNDAADQIEALNSELDAKSSEIQLLKLQIQQYQKEFKDISINAKGSIGGLKVIRDRAEKLSKPIARKTEESDE